MTIDSLHWLRRHRSDPGAGEHPGHQRARIHPLPERRVRPRPGGLAVLRLLMASPSLQACPSDPRFTRVVAACAQPCAPPSRHARVAGSSAGASAERHSRTSPPHPHRAEPVARARGTVRSDGPSDQQAPTGSEIAVVVYQRLRSRSLFQASLDGELGSSLATISQPVGDLPRDERGDIVVAVPLSATNEAGRTRLRGRRRLPGSNRAAQRGRRRDRWLHNDLVRTTPYAGAPTTGSGDGPPADRVAIPRSRRLEPDARRRSQRRSQP